MSQLEEAVLFHSSAPDFKDKLNSAFVALWKSGVALL